MRLRIALLLCIPGCIFAGPAFTQQTTDPALDYEEEPNAIEICRHSLAQPLPAVASQGQLTHEQLQNCDGFALYFGVGQKPDYAAALRCGWQQRAHPEAISNDPVFYGAGILSMLYANGKGVPRDYNLAIRLACEYNPHSPEDWWGIAADWPNRLRIGHLEHLRDTHSKDETFSVCDDDISTRMMFGCADAHRRIDDDVRAGKLAAVLQYLSPAANQGSSALWTAESDFEDLSSDLEQDKSTAPRIFNAMEELDQLRDQFLLNLQQFQKAEIPPASAADVAALDRELNKVYRQIQQIPADEWNQGSVTQEGIRKTERKWLRLVDAWIQFSKIAYPNLSETRIRAQLIRLRLEQIQYFLPEGQ